MKILKEFINPNTVNLTDTQQGVLVAVKISPTSEVAYETTNGSQQSVYARNSLRVLGLLKIGNNQIILTDNGKQVLINYNLVDESGQLTERGNSAYEQFKKAHHKEDLPDDADGMSTLPQS